MSRHQTIRFSIVIQGQALDDIEFDIDTETNEIIECIFEGEQVLYKPSIYRVVLKLVGGEQTVLSRANERNEA